jgi:hypothetical protein
MFSEKYAIIIKDCGNVTSLDAGIVFDIKMVPWVLMIVNNEEIDDASSTI